MGTATQGDGTGLEALPAEQQRLLKPFVRDGRVVAMPTKHAKRLALLDWLAQDFEPGRTYTEQMVNLILGQRHPDTAMMRRYLVDEGLMSREAGRYWRSGGSTPD